MTSDQLRAVAVTVLLFLTSPKVLAQQHVELTLNCHYESTLNLNTLDEQKITGGFSAIVQMRTLNDGTKTASIDATALFCQTFGGSFDDLEVLGECGRDAKKTLKINRVIGEFDQSIQVRDLWCLSRADCHRRFRNIRKDKENCRA